MKAKRSELITALDGRFDDRHAELARMLLARSTALSTQINTPTGPRSAGGPNRARAAS
jgi:transposase